MNATKREQAFELRLSGLSYRQVGARLGISGQRVQQIIRPPKLLYDLVKSQADSRCQACGIFVSAGHVHHKSCVGLTIDTYTERENLVYLCTSCHPMAHGRWRDRRNGELVGDKILDPILKRATSFVTMPCAYCHQPITRSINNRPRGDLRGKQWFCSKVEQGKWLGEQSLTLGFRHSVCKRGHPRIPENLYTYTNAARKETRSCKMCAHERWKSYYYSKLAKPVKESSNENFNC
mgnify:CR=1 FL=1